MRRTLLGLTCVFVSLIGAWLGVRLASPGEYDTSLGRATVLATPSLHGEIDAYIPLADWGVRARAFSAPLRIHIEPRTVDREVVLRAASGDRSLLSQTQHDLRNAVRSAALRAVRFALGGAAVLAGVVSLALFAGGERRRSILAGLPAAVLVITVAVCALTLARASATFNEDALERPTFYARGAELVQLLDAAEHARRAGDDRELFEILGWQASAAVFGPTPVTDAIARCLELRREVAGSPLAVALTLHPLAALHAMTGDFDQARELIAEGNAILGELGRLESAVSHHEALVELLAGRPAAAEASLRGGFETLRRMGGDGALIATTAAMLGQTVYAQDRLAEAEELCELSARTASPQDLVTQVLWRGVRAKALARRGEVDEAESLAREAVALVEGTDLVSHHGDALLDLAAVLRLGGREAEADAAAEAGGSLHERKGNAAATERLKRMEVS
jgi:tetratricopeptide (TPR) repeat protein